MTEELEDCFLCGHPLLEDKEEVITLRRSDGVATCKKFAKKRKLNLTFSVSKNSLT